MAYYFCIKCMGDNLVPRYIEVPSSDCRNGTDLITTAEFHGGETQKWIWDANRIVSHISSPKFSLAVSEVRHHAPILLRFRDAESIGESYNVRWVVDNGVIKVENERDYYIGLKNDKPLLLRMDENEVATKWEMQVIIGDQLCKKAITCSLDFEPPQHMPIIDSWTIENSVCVRKSTDYTYFGVIKFAPGGHVGLQQGSEDKRLALFTFFDDGDNSAVVLKQGDDVEVVSLDEVNNMNDEENVSSDGNSGQVAIKEIYWMTYQEITFKVTGEKLYKGFGTPPEWRCTCWYAIGNSSEWEYMATFQRGGNSPFNHRFTAYIKDWNPTDCESHALRRLAEFGEAKLIIGRGTEEKKQNKKNKKRVDEVFDYKESTFNTVGEIIDESIKFKAFGAVKTYPTWFVLSTGGRAGDDIFGSLSEDGYVQRTNKSGQKLFLSKV